MIADHSIAVEFGLPGYVVTPTEEVYRKPGTRPNVTKDKKLCCKMHEIGRYNDKNRRREHRDDGPGPWIIYSRWN